MKKLGLLVILGWFWLLTGCASTYPVIGGTLETTLPAPTKQEIRQKKRVVFKNESPLWVKVDIPTLTLEVVGDGGEIFEVRAKFVLVPHGVFGGKTTSFGHWRGMAYAYEFAEEETGEIDPEGYVGQTEIRLSINPGRGRTGKYEGREVGAVLVFSESSFRFDSRYPWPTKWQGGNQWGGYEMEMSWPIFEIPGLLKRIFTK